MTGRCAVRAIGAQLAREHVAVHAGHQHVGNHQLGRLGARSLERLARVRGLAYAVPGDLEQRRQRLAVGAVIVDDQNVGHAQNRQSSRKRSAAACAKLNFTVAESEITVVPRLQRERRGPGNAAYRCAVSCRLRRASARTARRTAAADQPAIAAWMSARVGRLHEVMIEARLRGARAVLLLPVAGQRDQQRRRLRLPLRRRRRATS